MCECVCDFCMHVNEGVYMCPCMCQLLWVVARLMDTLREINNRPIQQCHHHEAIKGL